MVRMVMTALWLGWLVYWLARARDNKVTLRREALRSRLGRLACMAGAAVLLSLPPGSAGMLTTRLLPERAANDWAGCLILAAGLGFAIRARIHLGRNWSGRVTIKQEHELIRSGPYGLVRHPIYTGMLLAFAGTTLGSGNPAALLATALILIMLWGKIRLEERWMGEVFGEQYAQYRKEVKALIPFVW